MIATDWDRYAYAGCASGTRSWPACPRQPSSALDTIGDPALLEKLFARMSGGQAARLDRPAPGRIPVRRPTPELRAALAPFEQGRPDRRRPAVVVGDGIGLWAALRLQRTRLYDVTVFGMAKSGDPRFQPLHEVAAYQVLPFVPDPDNPLKHRQTALIQMGAQVNRRVFDRLAAQPGSGVMPVLNIEPFSDDEPWPAYLGPMMNANVHRLAEPIVLPNTQGERKRLTGYYRFDTFSVHAAVAWGERLRSEFTLAGGTYVEQEVTAAMLDDLDCPVVIAAGTHAGDFVDDTGLDFYKGVAGIVHGRIAPIAVSFDDVIIMPRADGTYVIGSPYLHRPGSAAVELDEAEGILVSALALGQTPIGDWPGLPDGELARLDTALRHLRMNGELPPDIPFLAGQRVVPEQGLTIRKEVVPVAPGRLAEHGAGLRVHVYGAGSVGGSIAPYLGRTVAHLVHDLVSDLRGPSGSMMLMDSSVAAAWSGRPRIREEALLIYVQQQAVAPARAHGRSVHAERWLVNLEGELIDPIEFAGMIVQRLDQFAEYRHLYTGELAVELSGDYFSDQTGPYLQMAAHWLAHFLESRGEPVAVKIYADCAAPGNTERDIREWAGDAAQRSVLDAAPDRNAQADPLPHLLNLRALITRNPPGPPQLRIRGSRSAREPQMDQTVMRNVDALQVEAGFYEIVECTYVHWAFFEQPGSQLLADVTRVLKPGGQLVMEFDIRNLAAATRLAALLRGKGFDEVTVEREERANMAIIFAQRGPG